VICTSCFGFPLRPISGIIQLPSSVPQSNLFGKHVLLNSITFELSELSAMFCPFPTIKYVLGPSPSYTIFDISIVFSSVNFTFPSTKWERVVRRPTSKGNFGVVGAAVDGYAVGGCVVGGIVVGGSVVGGIVVGGCVVGAIVVGGCVVGGIVVGGCVVGGCVVSGIVDGACVVGGAQIPHVLWHRFVTKLFFPQYCLYCAHLVEMSSQTAVVVSATSVVGAVHIPQVL